MRQSPGQARVPPWIRGICVFGYDLTLSCLFRRHLVGVVWWLGLVQAQIVATRTTAVETEATWRSQVCD